MRDFELSQFRVFIQKDRLADAIDFTQLISISTSELGITPNQFWGMPFFMLTSLLNKRVKTKDKKRNRKYVVDSLRFTRQKFGWQ